MFYYFIIIVIVIILCNPKNIAVNEIFTNILKMCSFHALKAVVVFKGLESCGTLGRRHGGKFVPRLTAFCKPFLAGA